MRHGPIHPSSLRVIQGLEPIPAVMWQSRGVGGTLHKRQLMLSNLECLINLTHSHFWTVKPEYLEKTKDLLAMRKPYKPPHPCAMCSQKR